MVTSINLKDYLGPISTGVSASDILPPIPFTTNLPVSPEEMKEFCKEFNEAYQKGLEIAENAVNPDFWASQYEKAKQEINTSVEDAKTSIRATIDDIKNPEFDENGNEIGFFEKLSKDIVDALSELTDDLVEMVQNVLKVIYVLLSDCFGVGTETLSPILNADLKGITKSGIESAAKTANEGAKFLDNGVSTAINLAVNGIPDAVGYIEEAMFPYAIKTIRNKEIYSIVNKEGYLYNTFKETDYVSFYENFPSSYHIFRGIGSTKENSIQALKDIMVFYLSVGVKDESTYLEAQSLQQKGMTSIYEGFQPIKDILKGYYK
jgi:hypothetical protein